MNSILITEQLPLFETVFGEAAEPCESDGNTTVSIRGTKKTEFRAYTDALMKAGAALHAKNEIAGNLFETYVLATVEGEALTGYLRKSRTAGRRRSNPVFCVGKRAVTIKLLSGSRGTSTMTSPRSSFPRTDPPPCV